MTFHIRLLLILLLYYPVSCFIIDRYDSDFQTVDFSNGIAFLGNDLVDTYNTLLVYVHDKYQSKEDFLISCISNTTLAGLCQHFSINDLKPFNSFRSTSIFNTKVGYGKPFGLVIGVDNFTKTGVLTSSTVEGMNEKDISNLASVFIAGREPEKLIPYDLSGGSVIYEKILKTASLYSLEKRFHNMTFFDGFAYSNFIFFFGLNNSNEDGFAASFCGQDKVFNSLKLWRVACNGTNGVEYRKLNAIHLEGNIVYGIFTDRRDSVICSTDISNLIFKENDQKCVGLTDSICKKKDWTKYCPSATDFSLDNGVYLTEKFSYFGQRAFLDGKIAVSFVLEKKPSFTAAFVGLEDGAVAKVEILNSAMSTPYSIRQLPESGKVLRRMYLNENYLIIPSEKGIYKAKLSNCENYKTCEECHLAKDPHCGWCLPSTACTTQSSCPVSSWTPYKQNICPETVIRPAKVSWNDLKDVELELNLPLPNKPSDVYECLYDNFQSVEAILRSDSKTIVCKDFPEVKEFPSTNFTRRLDIRHKNFNKIIVSNFIQIYNCSTLESCSACSNSSMEYGWNCRFCLDTPSCVSQSTISSCEEPTEYLKNQWRCPRITTSERVVYRIENVASDVKVPYQFAPKRNNVKYECIFREGDEVMRLSATKEDDGIVCKDLMYRLPKSIPSMNVKLEIVWDGRQYFIDSQIVQFYDCSALAKDCSQCFKRGEGPYNCSWHADSHSCRPWSENNPSVKDCPNPVIGSVQPPWVPYNSVASITIKGSNMGIEKSDIKSINVAGTICVVVDYDVAEKIICELQPNIPGPKSGNVTIQFKDSKFAVWKLFNFVRTIITKVDPLLMPLAGGTLITLQGRNIFSPNATSVYFGTDGRELDCSLTSQHFQADLLTCRTLPFKSVPTTLPKVFVKVHQAVTFLIVNFTVTGNPNVTGIGPLEIFPSGGRLIAVHGTNFLSIVKPILKIVGPNNYTSEEAILTNKTDSRLLFKSPLIPEYFTQSNRKRRSSSKLYPSVTLDSITTYENFFQNMDAQSFTICPDPVFRAFEDEKVSISRNNLDGDLVLKGENLQCASKAEEILVKIRNTQCKVTTVGKENIVCKLPDNLEKLLEREAYVTVSIGYLNYTLGRVDIEESSGTNMPLPLEALLSISAVVGFIVVVALIVGIIYRRKAWKAKQECKNMNIQLETLESSVRNTCRRAFTELQTDMTDLTSDVHPAISLPFVDYKQYTINVLFPSIIYDGENAVLKKEKIHHAKKPALDKFNQLLSCKQFLLILIKTLEAHKNFTVTEKAQLASLLMVVLQDKMEYATEIMKTLINDLIDKYVEKKSVKLLFRRTEGVVEKLITNWLSLCFYSYLKEKSGKALYTLFMAIKHQTEKGPVDAITGEALYSLSEDKLLRVRELEDNMPETLHVLVIETNQIANSNRKVVSKDFLPVRVLQCDSVTQAKMKMLDMIYKGQCYSARPNVHDCELEVIIADDNGRNTLTRKRLYDEDKTSKIEDGLKRLNTMAHYGISNNCSFELVVVRVPDNADEGTIRRIHGRLQLFSGASPGLSSHMLALDEENYKVFHLSAPNDDTLPTRGPRVISELFLTRLLTTKGTLHKFIHDLFRTILSVDQGFPPCLKYLFDMLDAAARRHNINDTDTIHTWKSNAYLLRFWVNVVKNPDFVFDINKSITVDSCLSVIAQTLMDACSTSEIKLGKDSPTNKLLFARDMADYKKMVEKFYYSVSEMASIDENQMALTMLDFSMANFAELNISQALYSLYKYASTYRVELLESLHHDSTAKKMRLAEKFQQVLDEIDNPNDLLMF
ncbi:DgyrCDS5626 [Dimorphilus gyrociliatus]|uniref:DgyrCDS5626 n=1 Tax=Dimorphilus gyrociliatus TaxID=2664684 RepID=A0A7I8VM34_9ANNE|nr:DgyrCDS5626 [Dimorphilus gyrociliatus]